MSGGRDQTEMPRFAFCHFPGSDDGWMEMQPHTHPEALPGCRSPGSKRHPRDTSKEEGTGLHGLEDALSKARPRCTGKEQSMSRGMQQPQTTPIQGFEQALSTEPARLGLKQEMFLQSDKISSDPEKRPLFPSAETPGKGAGHLMNYETLGKERLHRQVLNISFPLFWLSPARGSGLGGVRGRSALSHA